MYDQPRATDCARVAPVNFCGAGIPAFRFDWGFGRESVYLVFVSTSSKRDRIGEGGVERRSYLANALESAFLQLTFWLPMN